MSRTDELLAGIAEMDLQSLRDQWEHLSGDEAPPAMSKELLRLAIAHRRQEQEFGAAETFSEKFPRNRPRERLCTCLRPTSGSKPRKCRGVLRWLSFSRFALGGLAVWVVYLGSIHS